MVLVSDEIETMQVSSCCGADPTELCNEDTGFCPDCRDHTEFIDVCLECGEEECVCSVPCGLDTGCGETPCICQPTPGQIVAGVDGLTAIVRRYAIELFVSALVVGFAFGFYVCSAITAHIVLEASK